MMSRRRLPQRRARAGFTLTEVLVVGSLMTILSGMLLMVVTGVQKFFVTKRATCELGSYADNTTLQLKRDVKLALGACTAACPGGAEWLGLDQFPANFPGAWGEGDMRYRLDTTNPSNAQLIREVYQFATGTWVAPRVMARYVNPAQTQATVLSDKLVEVDMVLSDGGTGWSLEHTLSNLKYHLQKPG